MSRWVKIVVVALAAAVLAGAFYFPALRRSVLRLAWLARTEQQARRDIVQPPIATPTDVKVKARIFWNSTAAPGTLEPVEIELPLSADPVLRSRQLIGALTVEVPSEQQRTLPADATLLEFYLLSDGTAIADFSDALTTDTPSGILSEELAVDSIVRTLAANVQPVRRLKILIHGAGTETLAGHVDLSGFIVVRMSEQAPTVTPVGAPSAPPARPPGKAPAGGLTPPAAPGKLGH